MTKAKERRQKKLWYRRMRRGKVNILNVWVNWRMYEQK